MVLAHSSIKDSKGKRRMTIYQVTHKMEWLQQQCRNIYYYETTVGNPTDSEWQDIVDEIRGDYVTHILNRLSDDWRFYAIDYRIVDTAGLLTFEAVPTAGDVAGTSPQDDLPTQIALLLSYKGTTTKPNRARTYMSGLTEGAIADGIFTSAVLASYVTFGTFQQELNLLGTNPLSRVSAQWNLGHTQVVDSNDISSVTAVASSVPATQRRRRIGVGI